MQKSLDDGYVMKFDRATRKGVNIDFSKILDECNKEVAERAVDRLCELYNNLLDYKYFVLTGGTGEAWYQGICEWLKNMNTIKIMPCNYNDSSLPFIYANARGYYMFRYMQSKR